MLVSLLFALTYTLVDFDGLKTVSVRMGVGPFALILFRAVFIGVLATGIVKGIRSRQIPQFFVAMMFFPLVLMRSAREYLATTDGHQFAWFGYGVSLLFLLIAVQVLLFEWSRDSLSPEHLAEAPEGAVP